MKNNSICALGLIGLSVLSGCGGGSNNAVTTVPTAHLAVTLPAGIVVAGAPFTFTVSALDANNAVVPTYVGTVQITTSDKSATLPANATLAQGKGTFAVTFGSVGSYTITASDTVGNATAGTSAAVSVSSGPHLDITLPAVTVEAGAPFTFTVSALDANNAVVPTYVGTVQITTSDKSATLPANATLAQGKGTFTVTFGRVGSYTITASDTVGRATSETTSAVSVSCVPVGVVITPPVVAMSTGGLQVFTGSVIPQGGGTTSLDVTWSVQEGPAGGSITGAGVYTAPLTPGTYHVIATSVACSASSTTATVSVVPGGIATTPTGSMNSARGVYTATLLANGPATTNGKVLVAGGNSAPPPSSNGPSIRGISGAELYDSPTGTFVRTGSMNSPRYAHTATLLPNGKVLVAGGLGDGANEVPTSTSPPVLSSAELYDPTTGTFTATGSMLVPRTNHTATLISGGRVLIVGGIQDIKGGGPQNFPNNGAYPYSGKGLVTAEIYDMATGTFTATGSMSTARYGHTATLLTDGTVLIAGGVRSSDGFDGGVSTATVEIYDPSTNTFAPTGTMHAYRDLHAATLLGNGKVLVTGGNWTSPSAEIFDPATGLFSATGSMTVSRSAHTAAQLSNGEVLVAGGATTPQCIQWDQCGVTAIIELFDPATGTFTPHGSMSAARSAHTATLLTDGELLLAGGEGDATAELYP
jgi:Galactose oxidase, central domain/Kelch motif